MDDLNWILMILLVISFAANLLALSAFLTNHGVRRAANRFVVNMVIANLGTCLILLSCATLNKTNVNINAYERNNTDYDMLMTNLLCWGGDVSASWGSFAVLLVVTDTWFAVTDPLRYHSRVNSPRALCVIILFWIVSGILAGLCGVSLIFKNTTIKIMYCVVYASIVIFIPFILMSTMYWRIFCEARENGIRMRRNGSSPLLQSAFNLMPTDVATHTERSYYINKKVLSKRKNNSCQNLTEIDKDSQHELSKHSQSTPDLRKCFKQKPVNGFLNNLPPLIIGNRTTNHVSCMTNLRHRLSNASSVFRDREESRAARISMLVVFMFLGTYVPHGALVLFRTRNNEFDDMVTLFGSQYSACFILLASFTSTFLFAFRNKRVRKGIKILFGVISKTKF